MARSQNGGGGAGEDAELKALGFDEIADSEMKTGPIRKKKLIGFTLYKLILFQGGREIILILLKKICWFMP